MLGVGGRVKPATSGSSSTSIGGGGSSGSSDIISASVRQQQQERQQPALQNLNRSPPNSMEGLPWKFLKGEKKSHPGREGGREGKSATSANMNRCS